MADGVSPLTIVLADDDPDDRMLASDALAESCIPSRLIMVEDGEELMEYLQRRGCWTGRDPGDPALVLLDLNMPRKDGCEALAEIRSDPNLRRIPVVVLTTSRAEEDILRTYDLGVNSFIPKPVTFDGLVEVMRALGRYWLDTVELPASVS